MSVTEQLEHAELLTVADAKKIAPRIGYRRILAACRSGDLPSALDGNRYLFERADFTAWYRKHVLKKSA